MTARVLLASFVAGGSPSWLGGLGLLSFVEGGEYSVVLGTLRIH